MKKFFSAVLLLVFFSAIPGFADEKQHKMERAMVISQSLSSSPVGTYAAPIGTATVAVPIYRQSNIVTVETDDYRLEWIEKGGKSLILPVNSFIDFYRDGDWFVVLDSKHKKHKFGLVGMTAKTKPPAKATETK